MLQAPVNYCGTPVQCQPSYNAVKIDIHNPKVMDQPTYTPGYTSAYAMPVNPYYTYPTATGVPCYPQMPPVVPNMGYLPQPVACQPQPVVYQPQPVVCQPQPVACQPQPVVCQPQPVVCQPQPLPVQQQPAPVQAQPISVVPQPVPVVPQPVQQVINNGVPQTQTIAQYPGQPATVAVTNPIDNTVSKTNISNPVEVKTPEAQIKPADISVVLKGLQSNNLAEQSEALNKIGEAADNPQEIKKYLETSVLDSLLGILNADTKNLPAATQEQIDARTKWMNEMELPDNEKTMTEKEKELAMTLAPKEVADKNKQHAMYSIAILQRALASAIEEKTGEKLSIEKLPAIDQIVNVVKANPNPLLRASALVALAHLDKPEYKPVLNDIFTIAQKDQDPNVKQVATEALNKINGVSAPQS